MNSTLFLSGWGKNLGRQLLRPKLKLKLPHETTRWSIVKGDEVRVISGPQTGQQGKVLQVLRKDNRILVDGVNVRKRNVKPTMDGLPGKIILKPCTVHYSNVMLIDPTTGEPTKTSRKYLEDGTKVRVSKKSGNIINKPNPLQSRKPRSLLVGAKDTDPKDVFEVTFDGYDSHLPHIYASKTNK